MRSQAELGNEGTGGCGYDFLVFAIGFRIAPSTGLLAPSVYFAPISAYVFSARDLRRLTASGKSSSFTLSSQKLQQLSKVSPSRFHCVIPPADTWSVTGHQTGLIACVKLLMKRCFSAAFAYLSGSLKKRSRASGLLPRYFTPLYSQAGSFGSEGTR